jgi:RNA polymerase sigma-70 factor (ECF subfamily)
MPYCPEACNQLLEEFRAYLETLRFIQIDPRLRRKFGASHIIQKTLVDAWRDVKRMENLDADSRKRRLRKMLINNLLQEIAHWRTRKRDFHREESLEAALQESSCRLKDWLEAEDTPPGERLAAKEEGLPLLAGRLFPPHPVTGSTARHL